MQCRYETKFVFKLCTGIFNEKFIKILLVVDFQVCYTKSKKILKLSLDFSFGVFIYFYYQN